MAEEVKGYRRWAFQSRSNGWRWLNFDDGAHLSRADPQRAQQHEARHLRARAYLASDLATVSDRKLSDRGIPVLELGSATGPWPAGLPRA